MVHAEVYVAQMHLGLADGAEVVGLVETSTKDKPEPEVFFGKSHYVSGLSTSCVFFSCRISSGSVPV